MMILRLAALFLGIGILLWLLFRPSRKPTIGVQSGRSDKGVMLQRDPECGLYIPADQAIILNRKGESIYFCSENCRDRFLERPST